MAKKDNTFLLLSLEEEQAKKVANVISNEVCRRLLDRLAQGNATESLLSEELKVPISTVHYNLKQLMDSGLIKTEEYHYSQKGREMNHYAIANKYIVIAPKNVEGLASKLKRILPVFSIVAVTGLLLQAITQNPPLQTLSTGAPTQEAAPTLMKALPAVRDAGAVAPVPGIAFWFIAGALLALVLFLAYDILRERFQ